MPFQTEFLTTSEKIFGYRTKCRAEVEMVGPQQMFSATGRNVVGAQRLELWTDGLRVRCSTN